MDKINTVIAGDYVGKDIMLLGGVTPYIAGALAINKNNADSYNIIDENYRKSATSAVGRAALGAFVLGPVGLLAGVSAKNKGTHTLQINFKDGKRSLIVVDDKLNTAIIKALF